MIGDIWQFFWAFGAVNWLLTVAGTLLYWLFKLDNNRREAKEKKQEFSYKGFCEDNWVTILISTILNTFGMPTLLKYYPVPEFIVFLLAMAGGIIFRWAHEKVLSLAKKKIDNSEIS